MQHREILAGLAVALLVVAGCGGGGGYGGGGSGGGGGGGGGYGGGGNLQSAPGDAAINSYVQASHNSMLTATSGADTYTLQLSNAPNSGTRMFEGHAAYSTANTVIIKKNGTQVASSTSTSYFLLNPFVPLGSASSTGTPYAVVTSSFVPTTFTVGGSGAYQNLTIYHDSSKGTVDINEADTYSIAASNSATIVACISIVLSNVTAQGTADGLANGTETDCYTVNAAGSANLVTVTVAVNGTTLKFQ